MLSDGEDVRALPVLKPGYARNFLLPQKKALRANEANKAAFEAQKAQLEANNLETKTEAEKMAEALGGQQFIIIRSASDAGALYGSVTTRDAAEAATEAGFTLDRKQVALIAPIKELGLHEVAINLHPEVETSITLNVARSPEEAELQASGKSIQDLAAEEEAAAEFEIAELFDDIGAAGLDEDDDAPAPAAEAAEDAEADTDDASDETREN
ncbi:MAG: 50S ribosomal protein L9 [Pseudomonadota bacterium]